MEMSEPEVSDGKMWALHAVAGSDGMCKLAVWLDLMKLLSGSTTEIGDAHSSRVDRSIASAVMYADGHNGVVNPN